MAWYWMFSGTCTFVAHLLSQLCVQSSGIARELSALGAQFTLLAPVNSAFDKIDNSTMRFLSDTDEVWMTNFFVSRWRRKYRYKCAHRKKKARMWSKLACQLHQCFLDISSNQQYTLFQMVACRDFWQLLHKFRSYKRFFLKACRDYKWGWLKVLRDYSVQSSLWEMQIANVGQLAFTVNGIRFV